MSIDEAFANEGSPQHTGKTIGTGVNRIKGRDMADDPSQIELNLSKSEAIVLFELVSRFSTTDVLDLQDRAEAIALCNLCSVLERQLIAPFSPDYLDQLSAARDELREGDVET